ncbi:hypothetical protein GGR57DRAFT_517634 [Xylariaceae sp. FL1272]|nr:hypothetical protein GGR57DRAFT_517634 [Xylariaceae sp. FL1272]
MQIQTTLPLITLLLGLATSTLTPQEQPQGAGHIHSAEEPSMILKARDGRFKPVWVIGHDEDEEKGQHIGFRLFDDGKELGQESRHRVSKDHDHVKAHDDHESSFWYYY